MTLKTQQNKSYLQVRQFRRKCVLVNKQQVLDIMQSEHVLTALVRKNDLPGEEDGRDHVAFGGEDAVGSELLAAFGDFGLEFEEEECEQHWEGF